MVDFSNTETGVAKARWDDAQKRIEAMRRFSTLLEVYKDQFIQDWSGFSAPDRQSIKDDVGVAVADIQTAIDEINSLLGQ